MEVAARAASRASTIFRTTATRQAVRKTRQAFRPQAQRLFASSTASSSSRPLLSSALIGTFFLAGGAGLYTLNSSRPTIAESPQNSSPTKTAPTQQPNPSAESDFVPTKADYQAVYTTIAQKLLDCDDYDDGSYGPVLLRLGWHSSGSYDKETHTGGSNGATMRFPPEAELPANSGLRHARDFLEPIHARFPWISYSDLWTLAAVCAVQEMSGPDIAWRPGRVDKDIAYCSPDGRLPDGAKGADHVRAIYNRMGFDDREIVALIGAHAVGRCHADRSGFDGPWTHSPITFSNAFYTLLLEEEWSERDWKGPRQFENRGTKTLMMLPTDYCLVEDGVFRGHVERFARDEGVFFEEFAAVLGKLFELGCGFGEEREKWVFQRME